MDKFDQRWQALVRLRDRLGRGGAAHIAREIGKEPNYISRALYPPGKEGRKRIGEDTAELLDAKFPGWASQDGWDPTHSTSGMRPSSTEADKPSPAGWDQLREDQRAAIERLIETMLNEKVSMARSEQPTDGIKGD
ncbi:hypothetical protein [Burkholderia gladioli]|uniref:hypothetical protein n=1 Tax=Burkholderia gladioli TaxID=28095 RepID=UPI0016416017|nr:hypothetical protein [Burkholderia gladioli]